MSAETRLTCLRVALVAVGLIAIFAVYPLFQLWPSGWSWGHGHSHYPMMIVGIYATLGVFLLLAARDPLRHRSLIWFAVWSSVVHGGIMAVQAISDEAERGHLLGDIPALLLIALVLAWLMPKPAVAAA
ncbi:putative membrane protein [Bradyrhizobium sp. USDA 4503]